MEIALQCLRGLFLALLTFLAGCGGSSDDSYSSPYESSTRDAVESAGEEARQAVYEERGADSDGTGADASEVDAYDVEDEGNYVCTQDCSGHEAGFEWAQERDISDSSECGGNSQSFIEGCEAFADARQEQADQAAQEAAEQAAEEAQDDYSDEGY